MRQYTPSAHCLSSAVAWCLYLVLAVPAVAQQTSSSPMGLPASLERPNAVQSQQRVELQRELERHAGVLEAQSAVLKIVAKLVGPAVVHIEATVPPDSGSSHSHSRYVEENGSGVIIEFKGKNYVLTTRHVVHGAAPEAVKITLVDGRRIYPTKVWDDQATDVAVMAVSAPDLISAPLGDSDHMQTGDFVLAVGNPFGLTHSVTFGIISAKGRRTLRLNKEAETVELQDFMQTDASINPGNSGGPLLNLHGEVIGINIAIASMTGIHEGIGFSIPSNMFMAIGRQLIETGKVTRAFMGVTLSSTFGPAMATELGLPRPMGAYVSGVLPDSPATAAKLQAGDVILEFDHTPIEDNTHLANLVSLTAVGKVVPVAVFRDRKTLTVMVEVGDASKFKR
jgi:serine protease Do